MAKYDDNDDTKKKKKHRKKKSEPSKKEQQQQQQRSPSNELLKCEDGTESLTASASLTASTNISINNDGDCDVEFDSHYNHKELPTPTSPTQSSGDIITITTTTTTTTTASSNSNNNSSNNSTPRKGSPISDDPSLASPRRTKKTKSGFRLRNIFSGHSLKIGGGNSSSSSNSSNSSDKSPAVVATGSVSPVVSMELSSKRVCDAGDGQPLTGRKRSGRHNSILAQLRGSKSHSVEMRHSQMVSSFSFVAPRGECTLFGVECPVPYKVAFTVLGHLSLRDLAQCTQVNREWHELVEYPHLWFQKCFALGLNVLLSCPTEYYRRALRHYRKKVCRQLTPAPLLLLLPHLLIPRELYLGVLTDRARDVNVLCMNGMVSVKNSRRSKKRWMVVAKGCLVLYKSMKTEELPIALIPLNGMASPLLLGTDPSPPHPPPLLQQQQQQQQQQRWKQQSRVLSTSSASGSAYSAQDQHLSVSSASSSSVVVVSSTPVSPSRLSTASNSSAGSSSGGSGSGGGRFSGNGKQFYFRMDNVVSYSLSGDSDLKESGPESWLFCTDTLADAVEWVSVIDSGIETFTQLVPAASFAPSPQPLILSSSSLQQQQPHLSRQQQRSVGIVGGTLVGLGLGLDDKSNLSDSNNNNNNNNNSNNGNSNVSSNDNNSLPLPLLPLLPPKRPIFGKTIDEIMERQMEDGVICITPDFLHAILSQLEKTATEVEGIFRVSGSEQDVTTIKHELEQGHTVDFTAYSPHTLTSFIKSFLKSLPEPIIPPQLSKILDNTLKKAEFGTKELSDDYCEMINQTLVSKLSMSSMALLKELVRLFNKIVEKSDVNKMTLDNLFIVILPTLQCAPSVLEAMMKKPNAILGSDLFGGFM